MWSCERRVKVILFLVLGRFDSVDKSTIPCRSFTKDIFNPINNGKPRPGDPHRFNRKAGLMTNTSK